MTLSQLDDFLNRLKETSSLTTKQKLLAANKYDGLLKKVLQFVYDPNGITGMSNKKLDIFVAPATISGACPASPFS